MAAVTGEPAAEGTDAVGPGRPEVSASVARLEDPATRPRRRREDHRTPVPRPAGTPPGDRQLLRAAALGDADAWNALVEEYAGTVWSVCLRCGLLADEAAGVSDLVWRGLVDALPHLDVPLETWLVAKATHEAQHARLRATRGGSAAGRDADRRARPRAAPGAS